MEQLKSSRKSIAIIALVVVLLAMVGIIFLQKGDFERKQTTSVAPPPNSGSVNNLPSTSDVTWSEINGVTVPPEPATTTNNATLAGVDLNVNGVRDDVERIIAKKFGGTPDFSYAMAYAKVYQGEVVGPTPVTRHDALVVSAQEFCAIDGASPAVYNFPMDDLVENTPARQAAMRALNDVMGGFSSMELLGLAPCLTR